MNWTFLYYQSHRCSDNHIDHFTMKTAILSLLVAGASAFAPASQVRRKNFMDRERFWTKKLTLVVFVSLPDLEASL